MAWDYITHRAEELRSIVRRYDSDLRDLEKQKNKQNRKEIEKQIDDKKKALRKELVGSEVAYQTFWRRATDDATIWMLEEMPRKEDARKVFYIPSFETVEIVDLKKKSFDPDFSSLPSENWVALQVDFVLLTPWYSKDDRPFHVLDNPVHKDRVFGVPFISASTWKGLLRWACRMQADMGKHLESHEGRIEGCRPEWILHLFGNEKGERENFQQGALVFYPTWFNKIGFEVINPHSRERRAGTQPIYYEVVPPETKGTLSLLYAPLPGSQDIVSFSDVLPKLLTAIEMLLTVYGFSAKRTAGWGTAKIQAWKAPNLSIEERSKEEFERKLLNGGAK